MIKLWHLTALQMKQKTLVYGLLSEAPERSFLAGRSMLGHSRKVAKTYFSSALNPGKLRLSWREESLEISTDNGGTFSFEMESALRLADLDSIRFEGEEVLFDPKEIESYAMDSKEKLIISDLDDTVLISYTALVWKRTLNTLMTPFPRRRPVETSRKIFDLMEKEAVDFVYVSRSEYNLMPMLKAFLKHYGLPSGPIMLTPFLSLKRLVFEKKDLRFKQKRIGRLLDSSTYSQVILIGDDTQHDIEVYAELAQNYLERIKLVLIRRSGSVDDKTTSEAWKALSGLGVPAFFYDESTDIGLLKPYLI